MSTTLPDDGLSAINTRLAINMANEGVPVRAIARILPAPADEVYDALKIAKASARIVDVPRDDWPVRQLREARLPSYYDKMREEDFIFVLREKFKLTKLEVHFFATLLRFERAPKGRLHTIVENLRNARSTRPESPEPTEQKIVDVIICKLRRKVKSVDPEIKIETAWGDGYFIRAETRRRVLALVNAEISPDAVSEPS